MRIKYQLPGGVAMEAPGARPCRSHHAKRSANPKYRDESKCAAPMNRQPSNARPEACGSSLWTHLRTSVCTRQAKGVLSDRRRLYRRSSVESDCHSDARILPKTRQLMKFSISLPHPSDLAQPEQIDDLIAVASAVEHASLDAVSVTDHPFPLIVDGQPGH